MGLKRSLNNTNVFAWFAVRHNTSTGYLQDILCHYTVLSKGLMQKNYDYQFRHVAVKPEEYLISPPGGNYP